MTDRHIFEEGPIVYVARSMMIPTKKDTRDLGIGGALAERGSPKRGRVTGTC